MTKFLGVQRINFTEKDTGNVIQGYSFWFCEPVTGSGSFGQKPFKCFVSDQFIPDLLNNQTVESLQSQLGKNCVVTFNRYGKIADLTFKS